MEESARYANDGLEPPLSAVEAWTANQSAQAIAGEGVRKVSVSMPKDLSQAVQEHVGKGGFSQFVTEAVAARLRRDLMIKYLDELDVEAGPGSPEIEAQADADWAEARRVAWERMA